jgi:hypothetical protein
MAHDSSRDMPRQWETLRGKAYPATQPGSLKNGLWETDCGKQIVRITLASRDNVANENVSGRLVAVVESGDEGQSAAGSPCNWRMHSLSPSAHAVDNKSGRFCMGIALSDRQINLAPAWRPLWW